MDSRDRQHNARPDIVLFINGIPFAVIECKAPHIPVEEAVGQMIRNQQAAYIPQLFKFAQLVVATNKNRQIRDSRHAQKVLERMEGAGCRMAANPAESARPGSNVH